MIGPQPLEGTVIRVNYSDEETGYVVARLEVPDHRNPVTVVGNLWGATPGETIRVRGQWIRHARYGQQCQGEAYESSLPASVAAIERYLASGVIRGIGPTYARRLVDAFGSETLRVIEEEPERLLTVDGIGGARLARIRAAWTEQREVRGLMLFLQEHQISPTFAQRIFKAYGPSAPLRIQEDPYRLARDIAGIGFKTADRIGASLGMAKDSPKRIAAGLLYLLQEAAEAGHVYFPSSRLSQEAVELLGIPDGGFQQTLAELHKEEAVVCEPLSGETAVYLPPLYHAEEGVSRGLALLAKAPRLGPAIDVPRALQWAEARGDVQFTAEQREALRKALESKFLIITGGPGTGKTTLLRALIEILERKGVRLKLAAPTGRAAKRMAEATGRAASTIHRLLEFSPKEGRFKRSEIHPLDVDLLVVDEASMIDLVLMSQLLKAIPPMAALLLLGDADQLPSVGPGSLLHDLIASASVPVVRLTEIFRQAKESQIVMNAHRVNRGEFPHLPEFGTSDFAFIVLDDPDAIRDRVGSLVTTEIPRRYGLDPLRDIQVITPMNRGSLGAATLNQDLQGALNPDGEAIGGGGRLLRVGDRVMQVRNNYDKEVHNGDLGWIVRLDREEQQVWVRFDQGDVVYEWSELDELSLAYAISVHKSQGSEYPAVVFPLHTSHYVMLQRNLLYTALSRGRTLVVVVGTRQAVSIAVRNARIRERYSHLPACLRRELAEKAS
ncbi:MAG: ATP-dependent RecD-like DNA helicase [Candidatus Methylomirabilales bacterium]